MARFCLIYSLDQNQDAEQWMTFQLPRLPDHLSFNHGAASSIICLQISVCKFRPHFISCESSHCLPFSRMPDRCTSLLDEASFPPSTHHDPSPARSGGAPPSRHDAEEPGGRAPSSQTQKNHRHKIHRTQHCSHQFGRPPMLLTLWEKYAGLKLKPKGSFCGSFGWAVKLC